MVVVECHGREVVVDTYWEIVSRLRRMQRSRLEELGYILREALETNGGELDTLIEMLRAAKEMPESVSRETITPDER